MERAGPSNLKSIFRNIGYFVSEKRCLVDLTSGEVLRRKLGDVSERSRGVILLTVGAIAQSCLKLRLYMVTSGVCGRRRKSYRILEKTHEIWRFVMGRFAMPHGANVPVVFPRCLLGVSKDFRLVAPYLAFCYMFLASFPADYFTHAGIGVWRGSAPSRFMLPRCFGVPRRRF